MKTIATLIALSAGLALACVPSKSSSPPETSFRSGGFPNFYQMSTRYQDCGQCDGYTEDKGWHCTGCATAPGTCNCLIGGFTIGGHTYDGKWYPGVNNPPGGTPNWPCGSPYAPPVPDDCGPT